MQVFNEDENQNEEGLRKKKQANENDGSFD